MEQIDIRQKFGITSGKPILLLGNQQPVPGSPNEDPDYVFCMRNMQDMITFWKSAEISMKLMGFMGTGKTSFVREFHARLNLPLYAVPANPNTESQDLIGRFYPTAAGGFEFRDGPLTMAAKQGCSLLVDEWNLMRPGDRSGLNAALEGNAFMIPETGEVVQIQSGFRVFVTENPKIIGYQGRYSADVANDDRFFIMNVSYMPEDQEVELVMKRLKVLGFTDQATIQALSERYVRVANAVRSQYIGNSDAADAMETTISTRSLLRWVTLAVLYRGVQQKGFSPVHYALERAKTFQASPESRIAIHNIVVQEFGEKWATPDSLTK